MIRSFKCRETAALASGVRVRRFMNIETVARRNLRQLEIAGRAVQHSHERSVAGDHGGHRP